MSAAPCPSVLSFNAVIVVTGAVTILLLSFALEQDARHMRFRAMAEAIANKTNRSEEFNAQHHPSRGMLFEPMACCLLVLGTGGSLTLLISAFAQQTLLQTKRWHILHSVVGCCMFVAGIFVFTSLLIYTFRTPSCSPFYSSYNRLRHTSGFSYCQLSWAKLLVSFASFMMGTLSMIIVCCGCTFGQNQVVRIRMNQVGNQEDTEITVTTGGENTISLISHSLRSPHCIRQYGHQQFTEEDMVRTLVKISSTVSLPASLLTTKPYSSQYQPVVSKIPETPAASLAVLGPQPSVSPFPPVSTLQEP